MKEPLISVIIPVYNTEKYLEKFLNSVVNQIYRTLEIILINDGSTDSSLEILERYARDDSRIKLLSQKNSGVSASRNKGMEVCTGEWISFLDSDDYIDKNLYSNFVNAVNNSNDFNIYCFNGVIVFPNDNPNDEKLRKFFYMSNWIHHENNLYSFTDCLNPFYGNLSVSNKIYRANFLNENKLRFKIATFEDQLFSIESMIKAKSIYLDNRTYYYYLQHTESTMGTLKENGFDIFNIMSDVRRVLVSENLYEREKYVFLQHKFNVYFYLLTKIERSLKEKFFERAKQSIKEESVYTPDNRKIKSIAKSYLYYDFLSLNYNDFALKYKISI